LRTFHVNYSGDFLDEDGRIASGYLGTEILDTAACIQYGFLEDLAPSQGDASYSDRLYSLAIEPHHIAGANGLVVLRPFVRRLTFTAGASSLVVIGRAGVGTDKIDLAACTENDVAVFNAPDSLTHSTASATMVLILALAKKLPAQERMARSGNWQGQAAVIGDDLAGQTLGLIGLGRISVELVRLLAPFGMRVVAYSRHADPAEADSLGLVLAPDLDTVFRTADYVSLHWQLDERSRGRIGEREFRQMKPTAYFVNTARGEIVRQEDLVRALRERWIAGAGLDVFEHEPLPADDPLMGLDNVILTPHWLPTTHKVVRVVMDTMARGVVRASCGQVPEHVVNTAVLDRPKFRAKLARFEENRLG
jgi:phosphoglycerate dehydrogenase-like enzyme